jgi:coenzyme Q-binding protein COQ10
MPTHAEKKTLPYTAQQMFDLVVDVEQYPEFLPWCVDCRIKTRVADGLTADLTVGFGPLKETFTSRVQLDGAQYGIGVEYLNGPFTYLNNNWLFKPQGKTTCEVDFFIDFEFKNLLLKKLMAPVFGEAVRRMIRAFEDRAAVVYL